MSIIPIRNIIVLLPILIAGCAQSSVESDDFSVSGTVEQDIPLGKNQSVTLRCFCKNIKIKRIRDDNNLVLTITGTHGSVGYHGGQDKPKKISEDLLRFVVRKADDGILLVSKEYTYIHHAYIIDLLEISVPPDIELHIKPVSEEVLEGRSVE